jgi:hypothetical protein
MTPSVCTYIGPINTLPVTPSDPILDNQKNTTDELKRDDISYKVAEGGSYVVFFFALICDKVIGIELMGLWQISFFTLSDINIAPSLMSPLTKMKVVQGINSLIIYNQTTLLPERIKTISYEV